MSSSAPHIPKDLDEALAELDEMLGEEAREVLLRVDANDKMVYHMGLGARLRKNWGLGADSCLAQYFASFGIENPNDMSAILLESYWRRLHGKPIELEGQAKYYQEFWKSTMRGIGQSRSKYPG